jgi:MtN3 and saliva related transmembrane protein
MNWIAIVGVLAAICSMVSFVPQAWRIVKSRDTNSISPIMYGFTVIGFSLWTAYGIGLGEWPLIVTNSVCFILSAFIFMMTMLPRSAKDTVANAISPDEF